MLTVMTIQIMLALHAAPIGLASDTNITNVPIEWIKPESATIEETQGITLNHALKPITPILNTISAGVHMHVAYRSYHDRFT